MPDGPATGLFTDLYELRMVQSYLEHSMTGEAVFDLHVRGLPRSRGFMVACGLEPMLARLARFTFPFEAVEWLATQGFSDELLEYLAHFTFTGRVRAFPEGQLAFPYEPLVQVTAPLPMAQLVETLVLNAVHTHTVIATKAARCLEAARGRTLVDFGARRAHGHDGALAAARAAYIAGFAGTSLVEARRAFGVPIIGTMAHSYVLAFPSEKRALEAYALSFPKETTLLIDTFDTLQGARRAIAVARELASEGVVVGGVRLDSGDLARLSREVRSLLDAADLQHVRIFASGGLDEHAIDRLLGGGAPIDGFGVGTDLVLSRDEPALDMVYKLAAYQGEPVMKTSPDKATLPGAKQVFRTSADDGTPTGDVIAAADEDMDGEPLLEDARHVGTQRSVRDARVRFLDAYRLLPQKHRRLVDPEPYAVERSKGIEAMVERARRR